MTHLDGNVAAGTLGEIFVCEPTTAIATCATCGMTGTLAAALAYVSDMGTVLRCPSCTAVLLRFARTPDALRTDMRGMRVVAWRS